MKIRICMQSRLIAEGVRELVLAALPDSLITVNDDPLPFIEPTELFLTDGSICCRNMRDCCPKARFVLVDHGMALQDITFLLLAEHYDGVLSTNFDPTTLRRALLAIRNGQMWLEQKHLRALIEQRGAGEKSRIAALTRQEHRIATLVGKGMRNREIAEQLCVCEQTIKGNLTRIYRKLSISNRSQLTRLIANQPAPPS